MRQQVVLPPGTKTVRLGGRPPRVVLWLLAVQIGAFLLYAFTDGPAWVARVLGASGQTTLAQLQIYQPLSALPLHLGTNGLLLNMLVLWLVGSALERWWGGRRLLLFWAVTGVAGLVLGVIVGLLQPTTVLSGSGGATVALLVALAVIFPHHLILLYGLLPLKARVTALLLAAFLLIGALAGGRYLELAVYLGGGLAALPFLFPPSGLLRKRREARAKQRHLRVLQGGLPPPEKKDEPKLWN